MLETVSFSPNVESRSLISKECMIRFESLTEVLAKIIESGEYYADEDLFRNQSALKLNGWIVLGSLTETTLQIFLAFYMDDYKVDIPVHSRHGKKWLSRSFPSKIVKVCSKR